MGKGARIACILTPMLLTIASFVTQIFVEVGGWSKSSDTLEGLYFIKANFTGLDVSQASNLENTTELSAALALAQQGNLLADYYQIYLWNYCSADSTSDDINYCSKRKSGFWFNPVEVWGLNSTTTTSAAATSTGSSGSALESAYSSAVANVEDLENKLLGKTGKEALDAYRHVSKWMFIAYAVSFWVTLATVVVGIFAVFSRFGSFLTWLCSIVSTFFSFAASLTATILFAVLAGALRSLLHPYGVDIDLGVHALAVTWLATAFSIAATVFWLCSVCCCSGRSNPHHKSNKGGLWNAEPKGQGYDDFGRGRGLRVEKTGGGYHRVASPFVGGEHGDRVPLADYPAPQPGFDSRGAGYEPYRHG